MNEVQRNTLPRPKSSFHTRGELQIRKEMKAHFLCKTEDIFLWISLRTNCRFMPFTQGENGSIICKVPVGTVFLLLSSTVPTRWYGSQKEKNEHTLLHFLLLPLLVVSRTTETHHALPSRPVHCTPALWPSRPQSCLSFLCFVMLAGELVMTPWV